MINNVAVSIKHIKKIFHISDVHIRNLKRHDEYNQVFQRTFDYIEANKNENSIIVLGGDIVHAKTDMTPELVEMVQKFFKGCADLCYTILITGNHDCNLNNKNRLDALAPIVNALGHERLIYLKDSGIYEIADKHFTVMSVFDKPVDFIKASSFDAPYKIALHHGAVDTSVTDTGHVLTNKHVPISMFDGYDLTLLGDIHVPKQYLNKEKTIAYPGSLVQQNYAEALHHGLLVWDTETKQSEFVVIPNDYNFFTLDIKDGQYIMPTNLSKNVRLRLRVNNTSNADILNILSEVKQVYNVLETPIQKISNISTNNIKNANKVVIGDVRDIEFQNQLLSDHLKASGTSLVVIDGVLHINRKCNTLLQKLEVSRNTIWIPKKFTFANMFSYGDNNIIDFTKLKGLYGIFAPNAAGKSTLFEALAYCIFDKCNRTSKAEQVLNNTSDSFTSMFEFEIDGKNYVIERNGRQGRNHVKVEVNFYIVNEAGEREMLNGKERSDTNKIIRTYLGNYEDFVLTSLSVQNNNTGFIDMGQRERKDLLAQFLDSDIFEHLYKIANEESRDLAAVIKDLSKQNIDSQLAKIVKQLNDTSKDEAILLESKQSTEDAINIVLEEINSLSTKLIPLGDNSYDIDKLQAQYKSITQSIQLEEQNHALLEDKSAPIKEFISAARDKITNIDLNDIVQQLTNRIKLNHTITNLKVELKQVETDIHHKEQKLSKLDKLEYDENCTYCMNNIFVKDAIDTKQSLATVINTKTSIQTELLALETEYDNLQEFEQKKLVYDNMITHIKDKESELLRIENDKLKITSLIETLRNKLHKVQADIKFYEEHKDAIEKNQTTLDLIGEKRSELQELKLELQNKETSLNTFLYSRLNNENKKNHLTDELNRLELLQTQFSNYQLYMDAFSRDGIPYQLIAKALPKIETEVNNILSQVVDYQIHFDTDGKNINAFIVYDTERFWPLELASGMEKFVASLAIRTSLINVSSLPRPPFLVIDEGMGNLDAENLNNMYVLFDYLKTQFEYMIVISHIDSIRDMVDSVIEITKIQDKSSIIYS